MRTPPTFSGQTSLTVDRHGKRGNAPGNQTPAHLQSPSRGALAVVDNFQKKSAAEAEPKLDKSEPEKSEAFEPGKLEVGMKAVNASEFAHPECVRGA